MESNEMIKLARYRNTPYTVNYPTTNGIRTFEWAGSKGKKVDIKSIPEEVVNWLQMNTMCFKKGQLKIVEDTPLAKEIVKNIPDQEDYKKNIHTKEEVLAILKGNYLKMKNWLEQITADEEKKFVIDVAKEISNDLASGKTKLLSEWANIPQDILFE